MKKFSKTELIIFLGLILLGAILRIYKLDIFPAGFHGDEGWTGLEARRILKDGFIGFWSPSALGQSALPFYWTAIFFKIFGESIFTARLSFALLNIFWIPFFYLLIRLIFSKATAIIATFLLITGSTPLAFSRRADFVAVSLSFFPAIFLLLLSLKTNKKMHFILAGIFIGLSHHMYASYWITPIAFGVFTIYLILILKREFFRKYAKNFALLLISYLFFAFPMILLAITNPDAIFSRSHTISIFSSQGLAHIQTYLGSKATIFDALLHNTKVTLGMFNLTNDPDSWNNFNNNPLFDPITAIFFFLGLIYCLRKFRDKQILFIYVLFFTFLLGSIFTIDAPNFRRSQESIYIAYIFVGVGLLQTYKLIVSKIQFIKKPLAIFGAILIIYIGFYNTHLYFNKYSISQEARYVLADRLVQVAKFINTLPKSTYVYFYSTCCAYGHQTLQFLLPNIPGESRSKEFGIFSLGNHIRDKNVVYVFLPTYTDNLSKIELMYPGGIKSIRRDADGSIMFNAYFLKKQQ